jgi:YVTN family beta-propeller protein
MMRGISVAMALSMAAGSLLAAPTARYQIVERIAAPDGGFDYLSVDGAKQRLFVAREDGVMAVDLRTKKVTPKLVEGNESAAVLIIPDTDLMLSTHWGSNSTTLFDRNSGAVKARIPVGKNPDAAFFDPASKLAFVMNAGTEDVSVIDIAKAAVVGKVAVGGKPEAATSDGHGRLYVNVEDTNSIAVIDIASRKLVQRYALPGCTEPTGIAHDAGSGLLISACHNNVAKLIDARTGADRGSVKIGAGADGAIFDSTRKLAFVPCSDGTLTIFELNPQGKATVVEVVRTERGARTAAVDPTTGNVYLATAQLQDDGKEDPSAVPGTFHILVVAKK